MLTCTLSTPRKIERVDIIQENSFFLRPFSGAKDNMTRSQLIHGLLLLN